jgi:Cysteine-rich secretory protein family
MTLTKQRQRKLTGNHRKLQGAHHKQNEHYIKAYWPYLPVFAVLGLGILVNTLISHHSHSVLGYSTQISSSVLLTDTNQARSQHNEPALELDPDLTKAAQAKANDMAKRNYWSHVTPDGQQPWSFIENTNYQFMAAGENLAYGFGTSDQTVTAWMGSTEHRANILNSAYRDVGFATANVANFQNHGPETIIVALYGEPSNLNASVRPNSSYVNLANSQPVSRLQIITTATWVQLGLAALCGAVLMLFFVRHMFAWHKVLVRGEEFVVRHPFLDVFLLSLAVVVFLGSQWAGTIL